MTTGRRAVVLLSGGLDSTTTLFIAKEQGFDLYALSIRYGQRHGSELEAAERIAKWVQVNDHVVIDFDLRRFGGSALTSDLDVPKGRSDLEMGEGIPVTYVPARNTVFLSFALAWARLTRSTCRCVSRPTVVLAKSVSTTVWKIRLSN